MISQKLVDAVHVEAAKLKENATKEELGKLDFETFNPGDLRECIYGQATGDCRNKRAVTLIRKCASLIIHSNLTHQSCTLIRAAKKTFEAERNADRANNYFSPIEVYIAQGGADNEQIIRYLKGQRKTLDLNKTVNC